jgi:enoyl-CoA hydratase
MVLAMTQQLQTWAQKPSIKAVVIQAQKGRAFCAGGDLQYAYKRWSQGDAKLNEFFRDEYSLNKILFHFSKPYLAFLDGITMGGGTGISLHGSHQIATENLLFAMPETGIGFFPDVGGTYFLSRLSHHIGTYLALTGARLNTDDCVALGLASNKVCSHSLPSILSDLVAAPLGEHAKQAVSSIINKYTVPLAKSAILQNKLEIATYFNQATLAEISRSLSAANTPLAIATQAELAKKSPTSLEVTLRALHEAKTKTFDECMQLEYRLMCRFLQGHDFFEGIRAVVIDKDQSPRWLPAHPVEQYFAPLEHEFSG